MRFITIFIANNIAFSNMFYCIFNIITFFRKWVSKYFNRTIRIDITINHNIITLRDKYCDIFLWLLWILKRDIKIIASNIIFLIYEILWNIASNSTNNIFSFHLTNFSNQIHINDIL